MKDTLKQAARKTLLVIRDIGVSLLGITGWLFHALLALVTAGFILGAILCLLIYAKVKPDLDECRELAYDKLAQMERTDFSKLSDTVIYDKDGRQIGLINAGHYQYVGITGISMNIQNAYIAQEDRRFKSHTGVDWIATFRAGLALVKHRGQVTQGGSTITQQVIKNTYLTQEQTFTRKIVEILLAPEIEKEVLQSRYYGVLLQYQFLWPPVLRSGSCQPLLFRQACGRPDRGGSSCPGRHQQQSLGLRSGSPSQSIP